MNQGRVRRIDRRGIITTVARVPAAAGVAIDPTGRFLAIASIEGWVYRVELATGTRQRLAGDGTDASSGDGGPAAAAQLSGPHDVTYDAAGNLLIAELTAHSPDRRADGDDRDGVLPPGVQGRSRPARHVLPARRATPKAARSRTWTHAEPS